MSDNGEYMRLITGIRLRNSLSLRHSRKGKIELGGGVARHAPGKGVSNYRVIRKTYVLDRSVEWL